MLGGLTAGVQARGGILIGTGEISQIRKEISGKQGDTLFFSLKWSASELLWSHRV